MGDKHRLAIGHELPYYTGVISYTPDLAGRLLSPYPQCRPRSVYRRMDDRSNAKSTSPTRHLGGQRCSDGRE